MELRVAALRPLPLPLPLFEGREAPSLHSTRQVFSYLPPLPRRLNHPTLVHASLPLNVLE